MPQPGCLHHTGQRGQGEACQLCRRATAAHKPLTGGFQQEQPELDLNCCPSTESSVFHPQPPQNFHLPGSTQRKEEESVHRVPLSVLFSAAQCPTVVPSPVKYALGNAGPASTTSWPSAHINKQDSEMWLYLFPSADHKAKIKGKTRHCA